MKPLQGPYPLRARAQRSFSRKIYFEPLEERLPLALYTWDNAADTLAITLSNNERLSVSVSGGNASLALSGGTFTQSGGAAAPGSGSGTLTIAAADLVGSLAVNNVGVTSGTNAVTFTGSGALTTNTLNVALTSSFAGAITFTGGFDVTAAALLSLSSARNISVGFESILTATGTAPLSLTANRQAVSTTADTQGIEIYGVITGSLGPLTVTGRGGGSSADEIHGVVVRQTGRVTSAGGTVLVEGTAGGDDWSHGVSVNGVITNDGTGASAAVTVRGDGGSSFGIARTAVQVAGVAAATARITSNGGPVLVEGGLQGTNHNDGVAVNGGGVITSEGTGPAATVTVRGVGGITGNTNIGVVAGNQGGKITSSGGNVLVEGTGGKSSSGSNYGVWVLGVVTSDAATASVTVRGAGGNTANNQNIGVSIYQDGLVTSTGGAVLVEGTGGTAASGLFNHGVQVYGAITAGGTGSVTVTGTGGTGSANGFHRGIDMPYRPARISSSGGPIRVTGIARSDSHALSMQGGASIDGAASGASVTVIADSIDLPFAAFINAGSNPVNLQTRTAGTLINLGGADVLLGTTLTLGLTDTELDNITAGSVSIGDANGGAITVSAAITHANHLSATTGAGVTVNQPITMAANKNLTITALGTTNGTINLPNTTSDLSASGAGSIALTTARNIAMGSISSISTANGNITLSANRQATATAGDFVGLIANIATIQATGAGKVSIAAKGGNGANGSQYGMSLYASTVQGGTGLTIDGIGGAGGSRDNYGVYFHGQSIAVSATGPVLIDGIGGGSGRVDFNHGVMLDATVGSGGTTPLDSVTVRGRGGMTSGTGNNGVKVFGSEVTSNGGPVLVEGTGGGTNSVTTNNNVGVSIDGLVTSAGTGPAATVTVRGLGGGIGSESQGNNGVDAYFTGGVSSAGGAVLVEGVAGGSGGFNYGVNLVAGGFVRSDGVGSDSTVTVRGLGANSIGGGNNYGVRLTLDSEITSAGGPVLVEGTGGTSSTGSSNSGVVVLGVITSEGTGPAATVTVVGQGGSGWAGTHSGVLVYAGGGRITSSGGAVNLVGRARSGEFAVAAGSGGRVDASTSSAVVTVVGDAMDFTSSSSIAAGSSTVILKPETAGTAILLRGEDVLSGSPRTLGLNTTELSSIAAAELWIGDATSGPITINSSIFRSTPTNFKLRTASAVNAVASGVDINTAGGTVSVEGDLAISVNGLTVDSQYCQFNVAGGVELTGASLVLSGTHAPVVGQQFIIVANDALDPVNGTFDGLPEGATIANFLGSALAATITYQGGTGNDVVLTVVQPALTTLHVVSDAPTPTGYRFTLSRPADSAPFNLFDYRNAAGELVLGASDVQLVGTAIGPLRGSLVISPTGTEFTFVATAGVLPPDTYALTLRSSADGFKAENGELFDGDSDGTPGGDFVQTFVVGTPPANAIAVSVPHFARGPEQAVNVPTTSALGLPIQVSDGSGLTAMNFELLFDSGLLNVTAVTLVGGGTANLTPVSLGRVRVALTFASPLASGPQTVAYLTAAVPTSAASRYGEREVLDISALSLTAGGSVPGIDRDAVHVNAYFGDAGRNGKYDSFDVQQASRMAVRLDTGFQQHPLVDPTILADFNGNGRIDSFDVQQLSRLALRLPVTGVAALPSPAPPTTDTDRLTGEGPPKAESTKPATTPRADIDGNGAVDAQDVVWAIYYFNRSENGVVPAEAQGKKLDLNGDQSFDSADVLLAVTDLNAKPASAEGEATASTTGDTDEDLDALTFLLAEDLVASRKKK